MKGNLSVKSIAMIGVMVAVIEVCKVSLAWLPNIELTTFWIIMFTLFFGKLSIFAVPVFILIEGTMYGFGLWWLMYLYIWPVLGILTWLFRKQDNIWFWSILSSAFGFLFGFLCAIPYFIIGFAQGGLRSGLYSGLTWWVAGIPWDMVHGIGNFALMMVLYKPVRYVMQKVKHFLPE